MSSAAWAEYLGQNCKPTPNGNFLLKKQVKGLCLGIISFKLWFVSSIFLFGYFGSTVNLFGKVGNNERPHNKMKGQLGSIIIMFSA